MVISERENLPFENQAQIPSASVLSLENGVPEIRCTKKCSHKILTGPDRDEETK